MQTNNFVQTRENKVLDHVALKKKSKSINDIFDGALSDTDNL